MCYSSLVDSLVLVSFVCFGRALFRLIAFGVLLLLFAFVCRLFLGKVTDGVQ